MKDERLRKALFNYFKDEDEDEQPIILDNSYYDKSIIGISNTNRLIYDYEKMVKEYMEDNNCSELDAEEWIQYNTLRAIPYMGTQAPIIMNWPIESFVDCYGDDEESEGDAYECRE